MAEIRQGYLDDYTQSTSGNIGIGTSSPDAKLEIRGGTTTQELNVTGIATFGSVSGFIEKHTNYTENVNMTSGDSGTLSGEIVVGAGLTMTVGTAVTSSQGSVNNMKVFRLFQPPSGTTNQRPPAKPGSLFYNFDFKTIEFFDGNTWRQVDNTSRRGLGVIHLGYDGNDRTFVHSVDINSQGNSVRFGDLTEARRLIGAASNDTRGVFGGGQVSPGEKDTIDYLSLQTGGTATDFGNLGSTRTIHQAFSSSTRAVWGGSYNAPGFSNVMEFVEISTTGDAVDFGDTVNSGYSSVAVSSPTRGILAGGYSSTWLSSIDYFTIAAKGNGRDFGDLTSHRRAGGRASNTVRGLIAGGAQGPGSSIYVNTIDYITMASTGNALDFGDLTFSESLYSVGTSNSTRGIFAMGYPAHDNINGVEIATTGSTFDFGTLSYQLTVYGGVAVSDSHGGIGGH